MFTESDDSYVDEIDENVFTSQLRDLPHAVEPVPLPGYYRFIDRMINGGTNNSTYTSMPKSHQEFLKKQLETPETEKPDNGSFVPSITDQLRAFNISSNIRVDEELEYAKPLPIQNDNPSRSEKKKRPFQSPLQPQKPLFQNDSDENLASKVDFVTVQSLRKQNSSLKDRLETSSTASSWETTDYMSDEEFALNFMGTKVSTPPEKGNVTIKDTTPKYNPTLPLLKPKTKFGDRKSTEVLSLGNDEFPPLGSPSGTSSKGKKPTPKPPFNIRPLGNSDSPGRSFSRGRGTGQFEDLFSRQQYVRHDSENTRRPTGNSTSAPR